ncbi:aspartate aminotransferase family protein [Sphingopyxis sp.]|uniref:aspartate aminotransferase family protein n=1 Tax=Sphingopyxis sp. TaxID=1908224 RepID=UPI003D6D4175
MMLQDQSLIERRYSVLGRHSPLFYDRPVHLVRGEGAWVYDADGRRYLDVYNNVPHVGHCHPQVLDAMTRQAAALNVHSRYLHEGIVAYAERLTATFDAPLSAAMFCCTGTEANELALRIARQRSGATGIIVTDCSYHGNSDGLVRLTTSMPTGLPFPDHARAIRVPDLHRADPGLSADALAQAYADAVAVAIDSLQKAGHGVAAILLETIFSAEGLPDVPPGFLEKMVGLVRNAGGLFIADEVQSGLARTGDHMWGHQSYAVTPDLVTLGKPLGNGYPLAAVIASADMVEDFGPGYFNTFAANPVAAAAGMAVLDIIEKEALRDNARTVGAYIRGGLSRLAERHPILGAVRGRGLFFGVELVRDRETGEPAPEETVRLVNAMRDRGVLLSRIGPGGNVLKMRPPMVFTTEQADLLLSTLDDGLSAL